MTVQVEFFGIPRQLTGVEELQLQAQTLGEVFDHLTRLYPNFADACLSERNLKPGFLVNINGETFMHSPQHILKEGDAILFLSSDAGG